jgi:hypothetical protein
MSIALPSSAIAIIRLGFRTVTTVGANKNPNFTFYNLNPVKRAIFIFAQFAKFGLHFKLGCFGSIQQHKSEIDQFSRINFLPYKPISPFHRGK